MTNANAILSSASDPPYEVLCIEHSGEMKVLHTTDPLKYVPLTLLEYEDLIQAIQSDNHWGKHYRYANYIDFHLWISPDEDNLDGMIMGFTFDSDWTGSEGVTMWFPKPDLLTFLEKNRTDPDGV